MRKGAGGGTNRKVRERKNMNMKRRSIGKVAEEEDQTTCQS